MVHISNQDLVDLCKKAKAQAPEKSISLGEGMIAAIVANWWLDTILTPNTNLGNDAINSMFSFLTKNNGVNLTDEDKKNFVRKVILQLLIEQPSSIYNDYSMIDSFWGRALGEDVKNFSFSGKHYTKIDFQSGSIDAIMNEWY